MIDPSRARLGNPNGRDLDPREQVRLGPRRKEQSGHDCGEGRVFGRVLRILLIVPIRAMIRIGILMRMMRRGGRDIMMMEQKASKHLMRMPHRKKQRDQKQKLAASAETVHRRRE